MTMLLALIVIAALTAAGIGASVLIVTEFNTRSNSDNTIQAYYTADAGMERALFTVFNGRLAGTALSYAGSVCDDSGVYTGMYLCSQVKGNYPIMEPLLSGASLSLSKTSLIDANLPITIPLNQTVEYNYAWTTESTPPRTIVLSAPDMPAATACAGMIGGVLDTCMGKVPGIEVKWSYLLRAGQGSIVPDTAPANSTVRVFSLENMKYGAMIDLFAGTTFPNSSDSGHGQNLTLQNPSGVTDIPSTINFSNISGWVVRVTALSDTIPNLSLLACTGTDSCINNDSTTFKKSNSISIVSKGVVGSSSITLNAQVPWNIPSSGIFDYALFSEESLQP